MFAAFGISDTHIGVSWPVIIFSISKRSNNKLLECHYITSTIGLLDDFDNCYWVRFPNECGTTRDLSSASSVRLCFPARVVADVCWTLWADGDQLAWIQMMNEMTGTQLDERTGIEISPKNAPYRKSRGRNIPITTIDVQIPDMILRC